MNPRKLIRLLLLTRNLRTALHAWRSGIPWLHLERRGKTFVMKGTNIRCEHLPSPLPTGLSYQIGFLAPFGFNFEVATDEGKSVILVDTGEVRLWLDGADVTFIVEEVFGNLEYGVLIPGASIVIDIGMNVATTALFFAKKPAVKRVVAFEPSLAAIQRAERNLAINPEIAQKIEIRPYALGHHNGKAYLEIDPKLSTISKIAPGPGLEQPDSTRVLVEMRDAEAELQSVLAESEEHDYIILKVDCEGSEREIFQRLSPDILSRIDAILVEWHHPDIFGEISQKLQKLHFHLLARRTEKDRGMLYAFHQYSGLGVSQNRQG
jgi:FkbM family methyltransferase